MPNKTHELKTDPGPFCQVRNRLKTFEIRFDDRNFEVGDTLNLMETVYSGEAMKNGKPLEYTGAICTRFVLHIMRGPVYGLKEGWVIMSIY